MSYLLDTCTFLWLIDSPENLSGAVSAALARYDSVAQLSAVSSWEIAVKNRLGKLPLAASPELIVTEGRSRHGIDALPFDEVCIRHLEKLPDVHRDPFDWMLICQAIEYGLTILTPDPMIRKYPIKTLW